MTTPESLREAEEIVYSIFPDWISVENRGRTLQDLRNVIAIRLESAKQRAREEQAESDARLLEGAVWPEHLGETKMVIQQAAAAIRSQAGRGAA